MDEGEIEWFLREVAGEPAPPASPPVATVERAVRRRILAALVGLAAVLVLAVIVATTAYGVGSRVAG